MTTSHSPSQNRVTECINWSLEDLARAMRFATDLPMFLWKQAITHVAYVHNHAYSSAVRDATPYEWWHGKKPDVSHLCKFGMPVWILLQGQKMLPKMEPCSRRCALVGYDDSSKLVLYYSAETWKILTLRNFCFLEPSDTPTDPERIVITANDVAHKGESWGNAWNTIDTWSIDAKPKPSNSQKWQVEDNIERSTKC